MINNMTLIVRLTRNPDLPYTQIGTVVGRLIVISRINKDNAYM